MGELILELDLRILLGPALEFPEEVGSAHVLDYHGARYLGRKGLLVIVDLEILVVELRDAE